MKRRLKVKLMFFKWYKKTMNGWTVVCLRPRGITGITLLMAVSELFILSVGEPRRNFKNYEESGCGRYL